MTDETTIDDDSTETTDQHELTRRAALASVATAGASITTAASVGAQESTTATNNTTVQSDRNTPNEAEAIAYTVGRLGYHGGQAFKKLNPWHSNSQQEFNEKYEYQQRLAIFRAATDFELSERRLLTSAENSATQFGKVATEEGLLRLFQEAKNGTTRDNAVTAAQNQVDKEFDKIVSNVLEAWDQSLLAHRNWVNHLRNINTDQSASASVGYSIIYQSPFTDNVVQSEQTWDHTTTIQLFDTTQDVESFGPVDAPAHKRRDMEYLHLPHDMTNLEKSEGTIESAPSTSTFTAAMDPIQSGFHYPEDQGSVADPHLAADSTASGTSHKAVMGMRVKPPKPSDFNVDPADVEDVTDQSDATPLMVTRYLNVLNEIHNEREAAHSGIQTFANGNYTEMKNNSDQYAVEDFIGPAALVDDAKNADSPAESAAGLYGMGIPVNTENSVLLEFPNVLDDAGDPLRIAGYLGMENPPALSNGSIVSTTTTTSTTATNTTSTTTAGTTTQSTTAGLPVGEVIDPANYTGGIYFATWASNLGLVGEEVQTTTSTTTTNTTTTNTTTGGETTTDYGTFIELKEPFRIVDTGSGSDVLKINDRDISEPSYDWETVKENLEDLNQAQQDAQEQVINVSVNSGGFGSISLPGFDTGLGTLVLIGGGLLAALGLRNNGGGGGRLRRRY